ncbi:MAG: heme-binding protein [Gammaproteobacteria bacterium]|nr:heme-binding protein [Gammaproteobacteria bacterium]MDH3371541.1 heme-binding protein [Gammaproteobacteria bacterium]MDH3405811.1 heme-binding protein [Gammaproteobacteria bacterium]MDH3563493.1 heme-binding protein [Gammaproteobacteria bacterium]
MPEKISLMNKPMLNLAVARKIIAAAETEALKQGWPVVIAVVDDGGHLINLQRLDNAQFASVEVAIRKARAAVAFKRPTKEWEKMLADGQQRVLNLPGVLSSEGGVPLVWEGLIVGAIGVSGVKPSEDGQVARAGASVLE